MTGQSHLRSGLGGGPFKIVAEDASGEIIGKDQGSAAFLKVYRWDKPTSTCEYIWNVVRANGIVFEVCRSGGISTETVSGRYGT